MKIIAHNTQSYETQSTCAKVKAYRIKHFHNEIEEIAYFFLTAHLNALEQKLTSTCQRSAWQEVLMLRTVINMTETREQYQKSIKQELIL